MNPVYPQHFLILASESLKNVLSRTFCFHKLSLEIWILHRLRKNLSEYSCDMATPIFITIYLIPKQFLGFKNYKLYWFSNSFLALPLLERKLFMFFFYMDLLLMMKMLAESNAHTYFIWVYQPSFSHPVCKKCDWLEKFIKII